MRPPTPFILIALIAPLAVAGQREDTVQPDTVVVKSGELKLHALLYRPRGQGPFPAVLFNHGSGHSPGSAAARLNQRHPETLGPTFARHGYVFLYLFRRGDGLSADAGTPSGDLMDKELVRYGPGARNRLQLRLLEGEEMQDAEAGVAYLRALRGVDSQRIGLVGHSFGGTLTLLMAAHDSSLRAAVVFAAAANSWKGSAELRQRLLSAVARSNVPTFFVVAANDYSIAPTKALEREMKRAGKPSRLSNHEAFGKSSEEAHAFVYGGVAVWEREVFQFLDGRMKKR